MIADYIRQGLTGRSRGVLTTESLLVETDATGLPLIRATSAPTVHTLPDALQLEQDLLQTHELTDLHSSDAGQAD